MRPVFDFVNDDVDLEPEELPCEEVSDGPTISFYRPDQEADACQCLNRFFAGKILKSGHPVTLKTLYTQENLQLLLEDQIEQQVDQIYRELGTLDREDHDQAGIVADDVRFVVETFKECAAFKIPKSMASAIILIYIRNCRIDGLGTLEK